MGIFNKLFGGKNSEPNKPKKTEIADFFQMDIKNILDDSFTKGATINNDDGTFVKNYSKKINYKECGIFDTVEVRMVGDTSNVSFLNYNLNSVKIADLKTLINGIYQIYGKDGEDKGAFNQKDISDYNDGDLYILFGRRWSDYPKFKYPVAVQRNDDSVEIAIWATNK